MLEKISTTRKQSDQISLHNSTISLPTLGPTNPPQMWTSGLQEALPYAARCCAPGIGAAFGSSASSTSAGQQHHSNPQYINPQNANNFTAAAGTSSSKSMNTPHVENKSPNLLAEQDREELLRRVREAASARSELERRVTARTFLGMLRAHYARLAAEYEKFALHFLCGAGGVVSGGGCGSGTNTGANNTSRGGVVGRLSSGELCSDSKNNNYSSAEVISPDGNINFAAKDLSRNDLSSNNINDENLNIGGGPPGKVLPRPQSTSEEVLSSWQCAERAKIAHDLEVQRVVRAALDARLARDIAAARRTGNTAVPRHNNSSTGSYAWPKGVEKLRISEEGDHNFSPVEGINTISTNPNRTSVPDTSSTEEVPGTCETSASMGDLRFGRAAAGVSSDNNISGVQVFSTAQWQERFDEVCRYLTILWEKLQHLLCIAGEEVDAVLQPEHQANIVVFFLGFQNWLVRW